ncbi:oxidoreductase [Aestuariivirga litoralis]|uniref:oxidoreductase n=1 Tax=Aestuariivirga litoralis TaxID=2650924 RepID=UPI0018C83ED6|nr:oxidoreductase [Aestuariivirga litoralis]MBG1231259.1 SDR family oxidoreductase [Aestuariivirga litoralis]
MSRVALITGGAQGLGAATAQKLLRGGFSGVLLLDRNADRLAQEAKVLAPLGRVETLALDLADDVTPKRAVAACVEKFGRIDVLFNAAGNTARGSIANATLETFHGLFDVNVKAALFMMQETAKVMKAQGGGTIVNVSSMIAYGGLPQLGVYSASKAALNALTKHAAQEFAWDGIRTFAIALGWALTEGERAVQAREGAPADWAEKFGSELPAGRHIVPEDVAELMAYLVSPAAQIMNGAIIDFEQMPVGMYRAHPAMKSST